MIALLIVILGNTWVYADGIMLPVDTCYPRPFLKNLLTEVTVNIHGPMVETVVYQEFYNEWYNSVDAVWNFPMPANARSTNLKYWYNDTVYEAELRVAQQVVNPGTGEGGIAALVNDYIGKTGIKLELHQIPAHSIQRIEFHYFSLLDYGHGEYIYKYPLNTSDFIQYYLSYLKVNININSKSVITGWNFPGYNDCTQVLSSDSYHLSLKMIKNKAYLASDFLFKYNISQDSLDVDLYSNYCDTMNSHFGLFIKPPLYEIPSKILAKRIVFLIENSSSMNGYKLQQSISAVYDALDSLINEDVFNIAVYNTTFSLCNPTFMNANAINIQTAKAYLQTISAQGGSDLNSGLTSALTLFADSSYQNCILGFSDGHSVIDPVLLSNQNYYKTAICFVGIGDNIDRERLEMTSALNYGFVVYADESDNLKDKVLKAFYRINQPLIKNINLIFNKPDISSVVSQPYPSVYVGSWFYVAGRYVTSSQNLFKIWGKGILGYTGYYYTLTYSGDTMNDFYVRYLWTKTVMDELERQLLIYGESQALKDSLISLSLGYKMKCRYTAYFQL
ncbi:MAG: VWA domain-containing protein [Bacteroidia bacterium]|nr:VWA domain-containing protein [Bacteroidia bacterium]